MTAKRAATLALALMLGLAVFAVRDYFIPASEDDLSQPVKLKWQTGISQLYSVEIDSALNMYTSDSSNVKAITIELSGQLEVVVLNADDGTILVGMQLTDTELSISGARDQLQESALSTPFRVRFLVTGTPKTFEFDSSVNNENREILKNLVRTFQLNLSSSGPTWVASERITTGTYEATYQRTAGSQLTKEKRNFVALPSAAILKGAELGSQELISIDPRHNWISSMQINESLQSIGPNGPVLEVVNYALIELESSTAVPASDERWAFLDSPPADTATQQGEQVVLSPEQAKTTINPDHPRAQYR